MMASLLGFTLPHLLRCRSHRQSLVPQVHCGGLKYCSLLSSGPSLLMPQGACRVSTLAPLQQLMTTRITHSDRAHLC